MIHLLKSLFIPVCFRHELNNVGWTLLMTQIAGKHIDAIINYN